MQTVLPLVPVLAITLVEFQPGFLLLYCMAVLTPAVDGFHPVCWLSMHSCLSDATLFNQGPSVEQTGLLGRCGPLIVFLLLDHSPLGEVFSR